MQESDLNKLELIDLNEMSDSDILRELHIRRNKLEIMLTKLDIQYQSTFLSRRIALLILVLMFSIIAIIYTFLLPSVMIADTAVQLSVVIFFLSLFLISVSYLVVIRLATQSKNRTVKHTIQEFLNRTNSLIEDFRSSVNITDGNSS